MIKLAKTLTGYILPIHVSAGAGADAVRGEYDGKVKVSVTAPPQDGKANKAICDLIAEQLDISGRNVKIVSGQKSREIKHKRRKRRMARDSRKIRRSEC